MKKSADPRLKCGSQSPVVDVHPSSAKPSGTSVAGSRRSSKQTSETTVEMTDERGLSSTELNSETRPSSKQAGADAHPPSDKEQVEADPLSKETEAKEDDNKDVVEHAPPGETDADMLSLSAKTDEERPSTGDTVILTGRDAKIYPSPNEVDKDIVNAEAHPLQNETDSATLPSPKGADRKTGPVETDIEIHRPPSEIDIETGPSSNDNDVPTLPPTVERPQTAANKKKTESSGAAELIGDKDAQSPKAENPVLLLL